MPQPVVHFEIGCQDLAASASFYAKAFGWDINEQQTMVPHTANGIGGHLNSLGHEPHRYVLFYIQVDDLDASLKTIESLGGRTIVPPTEVPNMGHFAWFQDPEERVLGLWKPL